MSALRMTEEQVAKLKKRHEGAPACQSPAVPAPSKWRNKPTTRHGLRFDSMGEADRWDQLKALELAGKIKGLLRQVPFYLVVNEVEIAKYVADFVYDEPIEGKVQWERVVEDFKGKETPMFKLKYKLMIACHGIFIRKTTKKDLR